MSLTCSPVRRSDQERNFPQTDGRWCSPPPAPPDPNSKPARPCSRSAWLITTGSLIRGASRNIVSVSVFCLACPRRSRSAEALAVSGTFESRWRTAGREVRPAPTVRWHRWRGTRVEKHIEAATCYTGSRLWRAKKKKFRKAVLNNKWIDWLVDYVHRWYVFWWKMLKIIQAVRLEDVECCWLQRVPTDKPLMCTWVGQVSAVNTN